MANFTNTEMLSELTLSYPVGFCDGLASNNSNITIPAIFWTMAVVYPVELLVGLVGAVLSLAFICRTKTNLMVRMMVYMTIPFTLLELIEVLSFSLPMFGRGGKELYSLCTFLNGHSHNSRMVHEQGTKYFLFVGPLFTIFCMSATINITMLSKLCSHSCACCCRCCQSNNVRETSPGWNQCMELAYLVVLSGISITFMVICCLWVTAHLREIYPVAIVVYFSLATLVLGFLTSTIGSISLLVWYCVRCQQVSRRTLVIKELVIFLLLFLVTILLGVHVLLAAIAATNYHLYYSIHLTIVAFVLLTLLSPYPLFVFLYLWYSFRRPSTRRVRFAAAPEQKTGALRTTPESTRVSAFSHTSDNYDPKMFLSPSTDAPTEV